MDGSSDAIAFVSQEGQEEVRKIPVPAHRYTPLKENWMKIFTPLVNHLHLQVRFNTKSRMVEIRTCEETEDINCLQKAADFVKAFTLGFDVDDALALLRLDELFLESFEIQDGMLLSLSIQIVLISPIFSQATKGRPLVESHRKNSRQRRPDKVHHRKCHQN